ncbi:recombination protein NinG [Marinobacter sp. MDS2]|uniref:recombination protein NinG n=1 Tax=Marinobacter sp. MDS2 TaxID=3065961 RepID=UPI00273BB152|nr:recombination protein NinG [Marinobacter sp. MDS2]MDP4546504.1 recombination protein NinG [Marinobacter sp. MDS2]
MRKCRLKACRAELPPAKASTAVEKAGFCGYDCMAKHGLEKAREQVAKETRRWVRSEKARLKTKGDWTKEAQAEFNKYVRARDCHQPCISCGRYPSDADLLTGSRMDAGHYRSVGSCPELRFEELNCHAQCVKCNQHLSGNTVEYRIRLVQRLGAETVAWLEGPHAAKHYTIDDLKAIKAKYRAMTKELQKQREAA